MGVNKKFLLLAVIILGMQGKSYATIWTETTDVTVTQEEVNKHITASKSTGQVIAIQSGGTATINKDVTVDITKTKEDKAHLYSKFINVASESKDKISVNNGNITIKNESGNQFEVVSMQSGTFQNVGNISISGDKGIGFNITGAAKAENTGTFNIADNAVGVSISHINAEFLNGEEGKITVTGGTGILQTGGTVTNSGSINVSAGATGLDLQGGKFINESTGTITVEAGTGVKVSNGTFTNSAKNITNEKGEIIEQQGLIVQGGTGILQTGGTVTNSGSINISKGAIGLDLQGGTFESNGTIINAGNVNIASGVKEVKLTGGTFINESTGTIENLGTINISSVQENYIGIDNKGTINNSGEIKVNVSGAKGAGVKISNGTFTNEEKGQITVTGGNGTYQSGGTSTNKGTVTVSGNGNGFNITNGEANNEGTFNVAGGAGVKISNGTFTNEEKGQITVTGGNGIYQSGGTSINKGTVTVSGGNGFNIAKNGNGKLNNIGTITVNNGNGIVQQSGETINSGTINVLTGKGIIQTNGSVTNSGSINVSQGAIGLDLQGGKFTNESSGTITVEAGTGVKVSNGTFTNSAKNITNEKGEIIEQQGLIVQGGTGILQTGGTVTNSGSINISKEAIGLDLQGGIFESNGTIINEGNVNIASGIKEVKLTGGTFINESTGTIENSGTINISSTNANYIGISNKGTINNTSKIEINANGKNSVGIENQEIITNIGEIKVTRGIGILQKRGTVNNIGKILATGGTGVIIESGTTNNGGNIEVSNGKSGISLNGTGTFNNSFIDSEGKTQAGIIKVSGVNSKGIQFEAGGGTANNTGTIEVSNGALGAYFNSTNEANFNNLGEIKVSETIVNIVYTDNKPSKKNIVSSKGVMLNSKGTFTNYKAIEKDTGKEIPNIIVTDGAVGVHVNDKEAIFNNFGTINTSGIKELGDVDKNCDGKIEKNEENQRATSNGILLNTGTTNNGGKIVVSDQGTGIYLNGTGTFNNSFTDSEKNMQLGIIEVSGVNSKGIHFGVSGGTANNAGTIEVTSGGIGAYFGVKDEYEATFNNLKDSNIIVSGKVVEQVFKEDGTPDLDENGNPKYKTTVSKGIFLNSKGTATNEGNILVGYKIDDTGKVVLGEEGAVGVQVNDLNAKFTNNKDGNIEVAGGSQGIQVNKGTAINEGNILTEETNAVGVYMNAAEQKDKNGNSIKDENGNILYEKAEFINKNQIVASGTGAKGIQFGTGGGTVTNNKEIKAENGAIGVFFYQGKNNILVNSGIINAGENGSAIESGKDTNNTVVLKNGSNIVGNIKGNTGVDILAVEGGGEYKDLSITSYDKIVSLKNENSTDDAVISNSNISLEFNSGTKDYTNAELNKEKTGLTIKDSNLIVDLTNKTEKTSLVDTGDGKLTLDGNIKIAFNGGNGEKEFNISKILGDEIVANNAKFESSAMWDYITENKDLIAKKKSYTEAVGKSQLEDFGKALEQSENGEIKDGDFKTGLTLLGLLDASQFTDAMTQLSGGVHGYTVDFAAINSRTLSNTIKNRELSKDRLRDKALNSYDQEVAYINNNHKIGGLMNVDYNEDGALGINEKQIMPNGKLGLVFGGSKGKAEFENGKHGKANMDNLYLGGYYAYDFTDKFTLVSNANFVYSHTNVTRNIKFSKESKEGEVSKLEQTYDSTYPVFGFGGGATLYYTPYNSLNNSITLYGGIDWTKIVQGNINEDSDNTENKTNVTIKNLPADEQMYDSVVPHIGLSLSNNGYIFNRKYRLGVNVDYETELGNIKNGKKLKLSALSTPHRVETAERENIVSYSLNGALDLTEDFTIYGNYTKADSDEYDAERVEAGFKYKMDRMSDLFVTGPLLGSIENSKPYSRRWTGVASFILDGEDDSDKSYYNNEKLDPNKSHSRGDYATSLKLKPKFTLSLNDRDTKWSYYFETYYMSNGMGMNLDKNERRKSESRIHAEARWADQYSKGKYGFNIGYRNETTSSPTLSQYVQRDRLTRGLHQFRFTPNFTYNLGNGFIFGGSTTGIIAYDYEGYRKGQTDFELENEYGITYNGLMPRWRFNVNYFREETWYDNDFRKPSVKGEVEGDRRYQSNQLRPGITYFFGNGGRVELSARMPLGNGYWYTSDDHGKKTAEKYETRYGLKYYQPITPGLTGMIGGEILTIKTKNTDHSNSNYGKETRDYSIRPTIGISYNF